MIDTDFEVKSYLPLATQREIDRVEAISSALRTTQEAAFLTALTPYLSNQILATDDTNELILIASGNTVPTGKKGFKVGALFIDVDSVAIYVNTGSTSSATWNNINSISSAEIVDGAVTAAKLAAALDLAAVALTNLRLEDIGIPVNAVAASSILAMSGVIVPGSHAESVVTTDTTEVADGDTLTIGTIVYRFKDTMAQAYDVKRSGTAATTLDNLKAAINASGTEGVEYFAGTLAHPDVVATTNTDTTQKVVARVPGTAANTKATTTTASHLSWPDTTLGGGTGASNPGVAPETVTIDGHTYSFVDVLSETNGAAAIANQVLFGADTAAALSNLKLAINHGATEGTNYSTGTVLHATVTGTTLDATNLTVEAKIKGVAGNSIATSETVSNGVWSNGANLANGVNGTVAGKGKVGFDTDGNMYLCLANNTIADANWVKQAFTTF